ncbi:MAG: glucokinase [Thiotrichaceae bacterium IS1]|nr:MAG: glucokinase [Thiotrichaceae bacterium IS1]
MSLRRKQVMILVGDIGGTNTSLGLYKQGDTKNSLPVRVGDVKTYSSKKYSKSGLITMMEDFLSQTTVKQTDIKVACFGVAGSVEQGSCKLSNLNWIITEKSLSEFLNQAPVVLLNDLEAMGYGVPILPTDNLKQINPDAKPDPANDKRPRAVIAAGTGLGEAGLLWKEEIQTFHPLPSEGGHADFAPCNKQQIKLLRYLLKREEFNEHVSYERVLSGPGLFNIYQSLRDKQKYGAGNSDTKNRLEQEDKKPEDTRDHAAIISEIALTKKDLICEKALDELMSIYGAEAGNLVLRYKALGGIYVAGNIALKNLEKLQDGTFMEAFKSKGRFQNFVSKVPIYVVLDTRVGLLGAAQRALNLIGFTSK